jgi:hypothetical protein
MRFSQSGSFINLCGFVALVMTNPKYEVGKTALTAALENAYEIADVVGRIELSNDPVYFSDKKARIAIRKGAIEMHKQLLVIKDRLAYVGRVPDSAHNKLDKALNNLEDDIARLLGAQNAVQQKQAAEHALAAYRGALSDVKELL